MSHHTIKQKTQWAHSQSTHPSQHHRGERQDTPGTDHHTNVSHQPNPHTVEGRKVQPVFTVNCAAQVTVLP